MIRPLRRKHPVMIAVVGAIAIPLYILALVVRPEPAAQERLPDALAEPAAAIAASQIVELPSTPPTRVRQLPLGIIETESDGTLEGADLLLYWAPTDEPTVAAGNLLGALLRGERQVFSLPDIAMTTDGVLIVYSLAHGDPLTSVDWPAANGG